MRKVVFVAPFLMRATTRFIEGAAAVEGAAVYLVSKDPIEKLPESLRKRLAGHWRIDGVLDLEQLCEAVRSVARAIGGVDRLIGTLEQLQIPLAEIRERLGIEGVSVPVARNFREKARMKNAFRNQGVPCARHCLATSLDEALGFVEGVGLPVIVKPPDGAGSRDTSRVRSPDELATLLGQQRPSPERPLLLEEMILGDEHTFESAWVEGRMVWHSITRYFPNPLHVLENPWIQMCMLTPREIDHPHFDDIRECADLAVRSLGLRSGFTHLEWFRRFDRRIAISEVAARPPGGQLTSMTGYAHDFDIHRAWAELLIFERFDPPPRLFATGTVFLRGQGKGRVEAIHGLDAIRSELGEMIVEAKLPQYGQPGSSTYEGEGYLILKHPRTDMIEKALDFILAQIRVVLA